MKAFLFWLAFVAMGASPALATDELAAAQPTDGARFSYVLTANAPQNVSYAVILMPGGSGKLNPRMEGGRIVMALSGNFLIRSRSLFADSQFVAASTDATSTASRIRAIVADLQRRYGTLQVYVVGTSSSTNSTLALAETMDGQVAGFIHTSSFNRISSFDPRQLKSRNLIVVHDKDLCKFTRPSGGISSHNSYGTDLIVMDGGKSTGDECEAYAYHGYNGIERETVGKIKAWITKADAKR